MTVATRYPDVHYQMVAEVYEEAFAETHRTNLAVAETWQVPLSTAARWVKEARRRGLLGERPRRCSCHT